MKKILLILTFCLSLESLAQDRLQRLGQASLRPFPIVRVGDVLWMGTYYKDARAELSGPNIRIESREGSVVIPWDKAPAKARDGLADARKDAGATAKQKTFMLLNATEKEIVAKYGQGQTVSDPIAPAQKRLLYDLGAVTLNVHLWDGKCVIFFVVKKQGDLTADEQQTAFARAGGEWRLVPKTKDIYERGDGGMAITFGSLFRAETGPFFNARQK